MDITDKNNKNKIKNDKSIKDLSETIDINENIENDIECHDTMYEYQQEYEEKDDIEQTRENMIRFVKENYIPLCDYLTREKFYTFVEGIFNDM